MMLPSMAEEARVCDIALESGCATSPKQFDNLHLQKLRSVVCRTEALPRISNQGPSMTHAKPVAQNAYKGAEMLLEFPQHGRRIL